MVPSMKFARILKLLIIDFILFLEWVVFGPGPTRALIRPGPIPKSSTWVVVAALQRESGFIQRRF